MRRLAATVLVATLAWGCAPKAPPAEVGYDVAEKSLERVAADIRSGAVSSEAVTKAYLDRIEAIDRAGPTLRSVLATNPTALADARARDAELAQGKPVGPLHGVPILLKDNIESLDPMATTAGSLALKGNVTGRDAPLVAKLRAAGAVILGKTNLSEWANIRSSASISGWSAVGGLTKNPYALDRNTCGSSAGSGAAAAASLAAGTVGTETDGSIVCPSSVNGLVGVKPTVGLISRTHVVPISHSQDTAGPMTRTVRDAALMLSVMSGADPADVATIEADARKADYAAALDASWLKGKRIGVLRFLAGYHAGVDAVFAAALDKMRAAGAEIVEIESMPTLQKIGEAEFVVLMTETKADIDAYLATTPQTVTTRTLADVIAFGAATPAETALFGQDLFEKAAATKGLADPAYKSALAASRRMAGPDGIDRMLAAGKLDALVAPTMSPAWTTDVANGDHVAGGASTLAAVAGYPHVTVPMGQVMGLPVGLSFIGEKWSEQNLLSAAYAFEQATNARLPPRYLASSARLPRVGEALAPAR